MQLPPSSGVSPIPFPLCAVLEGTHGTAPRGDTLGTRIKRDNSLIIPRALCAATQQNGAVACTIRQPRRSICSPPCGSCYVFEVAHTVYKNAKTVYKNAKTALNRCITRKHPEVANPTYICVRDLRSSGC